MDANGWLARPPVTEPLGAVADVAGQLGADELQREALALAQRLAEGRFYLACIGQFKQFAQILHGIDVVLGR